MLGGAPSQMGRRAGRAHCPASFRIHRLFSLHVDFPYLQNKWDSPKKQIPPCSHCSFKHVFKSMNSQQYLQLQLQTTRFILIFSLFLFLAPFTDRERCGSVSLNIFIHLISALHQSIFCQYQHCIFHRVSFLVRVSLGEDSV